MHNCMWVITSYDVSIYQVCVGVSGCLWREVELGMMPLIAVCGFSLYTRVIASVT